HYEVFAHLALRSQSRAIGTRPERRIERELPRLELGDRQAAGGARVALGEERAFWRAASVPHDFDHAVGGAQSSLDGVGQTAPARRPHGEAIHHDGDVVVLAAIELGNLTQVIGLTVHTRPDEALLPG